MGINTNDIGGMLLHIKDTTAQHNPDLNTWIQSAIYRYVTGDIKLHEVELLSRVNDLNIQDRFQRYGMFALIETARHHNYIA